MIRARIADPLVKCSLNCIWEALEGGSQVSYILLNILKSYVQISKKNSSIPESFISPYL